MLQDHTGAVAGQKTGQDADSLDAMSQLHAHARTPEADRIALDWLAGYNPRDGHGLIGETSEHHQFGRDVVLAAFAAGRAHQRAVTAPVLFGAVLLLSEASRLLKHIAIEHRARGRDADRVDEKAAYLRKAGDYEALGQRIDAYLLHDAVPRDRIAGLALSLCQDLDALISESGGVYGLHRNEDVAPWSTLTGDGEFSEWLGSFDRLRHALDGVFPAQESHCSCAHGARGAPVDASCPVHGLPDDEEEPVERPGYAAGVIHEPGTDPDEEVDPAATVRTIEAAVAGGLIPGIDAARLSLKRVEARLFARDAMGVDSMSAQLHGGLEPDVVEALRIVHDGGEPPCRHPKAVQQNTGDGTEIEFCPDCARPVSIEGRPLPA